MILTTENLRTQEKTYLSATLAIINPIWTDMGVKLGGPPRWEGGD
jgi:hypothetical protein